MAFVGANREVARLAGVRVARIRIGVYVTSGLVCGLGGVLLAASVGGFDPNSSPTYLLPALSAAFLGTAVIEPGALTRWDASGDLLPRHWDRGAGAARVRGWARGRVLRRSAGHCRDRVDPHSPQDARRVTKRSMTSPTQP